jgi:mono/diheme cytochrome c family protein
MLSASRPLNLVSCIHPVLGGATIMNRVVPVILGVVLACEMGVGAQSPGGSAAAKGVKNPVQPTPASVTAGKALYAKHCLSCHGAAGKGDGKFAPKNSPPADLSDAEWKRGSSDGELFAVVREGAAPELVMRGFKGRLTDNEIWTVVNYVKTLSAKGSQ